jgi:hypothetical protein
MFSLSLAVVISENCVSNLREMQQWQQHVQGTDNVQPGNDGHKQGEEDVATMTMMANNNCWARPPINTCCKRVETGMTAVQPTRSSTKNKKKK